MHTFYLHTLPKELMLRRFPTFLYTLLVYKSLMLGRSRCSVLIPFLILSWYINLPAFLYTLLVYKCLMLRRRFPTFLYTSLVSKRLMLRRRFPTFLYTLLVSKWVNVEEKVSYLPLYFIGV